MRDLPPGFTGAIELIRRPDVEGDDNRGWRDDVLEVRVDGEAAGHLRIGFIPAERAARWYPNGTWDWLRLIQGLTDLPVDPADPGAEGALARHGRCLAGKSDPRRDPTREFLRRVHLTYGKGWTQFKAWNVERPNVDLNQVYDRADLVVRDWTGPRGAVQARHPVSFRDLDLDYLLLREAARWMAAGGRRLHSTTAGRPGATAQWDRLVGELPKAVSIEDQGGIPGAKTGAASGNRSLDGAKVPCWLPGWATSMTLVLEDGTTV